VDVVLRESCVVWMLCCLRGSVENICGSFADGSNKKY